MGSIIVETGDDLKYIQMLLGEHMTAWGFTCVQVPLERLKIVGKALNSSTNRDISDISV